MILNLPLQAAIGYRSPSQRARVLTETWALQNMYCPVCVSNSLEDTTPGTEVVDFTCSRCDSGFQLKASSKPIRRKIVDAAYDAMIRAINEDRLPHFFILSYNQSLAKVNDLILIPSFCLPSSAIEKRNPLRPTARRAGWVGCNIILDLVPPQGRIPIINAGSIIPKLTVRKNFSNVLPLANISAKKRGWTLDVLTVLRSLKKSDFTIDDAYCFENVLSQRHPENKYVKPKIRQQLQILRDLGYLKFTARGHYKWIKD